MHIHKDREFVLFLLGFWLCFYKYGIVLYRHVCMCICVIYPAVSLLRDVRWVFCSGCCICFCKYKQCCNKPPSTFGQFKKSILAWIPDLGYGLRKLAFKKPAMLFLLYIKY